MTIFPRSGWRAVLSASGRCGTLALLLTHGAGAWGQVTPLVTPLGALAPPPGLSFGPAETLTYDSNVERAPNDVLVPGGRGDLSSITDLTATLVETYGREDVTASATVGRTMYRRFTQFDFTDQDLRGSVHSSLPLRVDADVAASRTAALAHFADLSAAPGSNGQAIRNVITRNDVNGSLGVPVLADWRAVVGGDLANTRNSAALYATQNFNVREANGGIRYQPTTGNHVDLLVRSVEGTFVGGSPAALLGPGYRDRMADLTVDWTFSRASALHGHVGYLRRTGDYAPYIDANNQPQILDRNFAGPAFDLNYLWHLTTATRLAVHGERVSGATGDNSYLSGVSHIYRIVPGYEPSLKFKIDAYYEVAQRNYFSNVLQAIQLTQAEAATLNIESVATRVDHSHSMGVDFQWAPRRWLHGDLNLHRESRTSNVTAFEYNDTVIALNATGTF